MLKYNSIVNKPMSHLLLTFIVTSFTINKYYLIFFSFEWIQHKNVYFYEFCPWFRVGSYLTELRCVCAYYRSNNARTDKSIEKHLTIHTQPMIRYSLFNSDVNRPSTWHFCPLMEIKAKCACTYVSCNQYLFMYL